MTPSRPPPVLRIAVVLAVVTFAAYAPALRHDFVHFDDDVYVFDNAVVSGGWTAAGIRWALTTGAASNWHPMTWLSHMLDVEVYGLRPGGHHLTSVLLHVGSTLLLFALLWRITGAARRSGVVAALFGLHPAHVESVAWVAERKDVLSAFFALAALLAYAAYAKRPGPARYLAVTVLFAAGLLSKPMVVTLPFVMLLLDAWPLGRLGGTRPYVEKLPWLGLSAISSAITMQVQTKAIASEQAIALGGRIANAVVSYVRYLGKLAWPSDLSPYYPHPRSWAPLAVVGSAVLLVALTAIAFRLASRRPYALVGWLWYLGTLVPVIGIVQVGGQSIADRYTYLPSVGLFVMVVWWGADRIGKGALWPALGACAILAVLTVRQVGVWKDPIAPWDHALRVDPENAVAWNLRAEAKLAAGDPDGARADLDRAIALRPGFAIALNHRGVLRQRRGDVEGAVADYTAAIAHDPHFAQAHSNLGLVHFQKGDLARAIAAFDAAIRLDPTLVAAYNNRGQARFRLGDFPGALADVDHALGLRPGFSEARFNRAIFRTASGDLAGAEVDYAAVLADDPGNEAAYVNRSRVRIERHDLPGAIRDLDEAIRLAPGLADAWLNRGIARQLRGDLDGSIVDCGKAIEIDENLWEAYACRGEARRLQGDRDGGALDHAKARELARSRSTASGL